MSSVDLTAVAIRQARKLRVAQDRAEDLLQALEALSGGVFMLEEAAGKTDAFDREMGHELLATFASAGHDLIDLAQRITMALANASRRFGIALPPTHMWVREEVDALCRHLTDLGKAARLEVALGEVPISIPALPERKEEPETDFGRFNEDSGGNPAATPEPPTKAGPDKKDPPGSCGSTRCILCGLRGG